MCIEVLWWECALKESAGLRLKPPSLQPDVRDWFQRPGRSLESNKNNPSGRIWKLRENLGPGSVCVFEPVSLKWKRRNSGLHFCFIFSLNFFLSQRGLLSSSLMKTGWAGGYIWFVFFLSKQVETTDHSLLLFAICIYKVIHSGMHGILFYLFS